MRTKLVLGVDPGHTTGWVVLDIATGVPLKREQTTGNEATSDFLYQLSHEFPDTAYELTAIVMEDYKIFAHKAKQHIGSNVPAAQVIGIVEHQARQWRVPVVKQPANILPMAQKLTGVTMPSNHSKSHWVSAYLHACFYLIKNGQMLTLAQKKRALENEQAQK